MSIEGVRVFRSLAVAKPSTPSPQRLCGVRTTLIAATLAIFGCAAALAQVKEYSRIVVFGDSLSDTGNVAHLAYEQYGVYAPGFYPLLGLDYTMGRFTDGADTVPAAQNYVGVWIEQLAAQMPSRPEVKDSLDGGTNYAYGFATTGSGSSPLCLDGLCVPVENIGQQITDYLSTRPKIDNHTLVVIWGGADDLLNATSVNDVVDAAVRETFNIQRLIQAGATQILVPNLPPLGLTPRFNGSPSEQVTASAASALFNSYLALGVSLLRDLYAQKHVRIYQLDVFKLMGSIVASPTSYSLSDVKDAAQGNYLVNPDTYLFWDDLHPTTRGHNILAGAAESVLSHSAR
ncbi:MAG TPA: SGNH/GDSL hydrolase family protein [Terracidiphilus sp.]|nr:SGNH/GDSL hydrolase family protein [Terracidiphilus sp.]